MEQAEYRRMAVAEESHWWYGSTRALLQDLLGPRLVARGRILDAGCGTGAAGAWLNGTARVVGLDFEPLALDLYRERHPAAALVTGDVTRLPFAGDAFDALLCVTVLIHRTVTDVGAAVRELVRVVRPGGTIALLEPGVRRLRRGHDRETHSVRRFSRRELAELVSGSGCTVVRTTGAYSFLVPPAAVKAVLERGRTASDLARQAGGLAGVLPRLAAVERRWLAHHDLPLGLSVVVIATKN
jgi:ubiquinone/menaquinone biosynthesis C-methylase UbiE